MWKQIAILTLGLSLAGCGDGRPDGEEARRQFERLYPQAEVIDVRITEDEVVARSIKFRYRHRATKREGEIKIQFMESEDKEGWIPNPEPPAKLPQPSAEHDSGLNGL